MKPNFSPTFIPQIYLDITLPIGRAAGFIYPEQQKDGSWTAIISTIGVQKDIYGGLSFCLRPVCDYYSTEGMPLPLAFGGTGNTPLTAPHVYSLPNGPGYLIGINLGYRDGRGIKCSIKVSYLPAKGGKITASTGWKDICHYRILKPSSWFEIAMRPAKKACYWADQPHTSIQEIEGTIPAISFPKSFSPVTKILYGGGGPVTCTPFAKGSSVLFPPFLPDWFPDVPLRGLSLLEMAEHRDWIGKQPFNYWLVGKGLPIYVLPSIYFFISDILIYPGYMCLLDYFYDFPVDEASGYGMFLLSQYLNTSSTNVPDFNYTQLFLTTNNPFWPGQYVTPPAAGQDQTQGWYSNILPDNIAFYGVDIGMGCIVHNLHAWI